jgi:hypothetical protein
VEYRVVVITLCLGFFFLLEPSLAGAFEGEFENTAPACQDAQDNDGDGFVDCADQDCSLFTFCASSKKAPEVREVRDGRGLFVAGTVVSSIGLVSGAVSLGLATQSTRDDAFLFSSIGTGVFGWVLSTVGGGLQLGGQVRSWRATKTLGGNTSPALMITSAVFYGLMAIGGAATSAMGPVLGPAMGAGSAPLMGPLLGLEVAAYAILLTGGVVASRRVEEARRSSAAMTIMPFVAHSRTGNGAIAGVTARF